MQIDILTLFPKMFEGPFDFSIIKRAREKGLVTVNLHDLRQWAVDKYGSVDDRPYGRGVGMVIRVDVVDKALRALKIKDQKSKIKNTNQNSKIILLTPQGKIFNQQKARELSKLTSITLICGHYEGFDERIRENLVDEELSIGEYVLTGGELPAMVVTDAITRLIPGVLAKEEATLFESFGEFPQEKIKDQRPKIKDQTKNLKLSAKDEVNPQPVIRNTQTKLLEYPQYTRPEEFNGWKVPEVLLSGNHAEIEKWKLNKLKIRY